MQQHLHLLTNSSVGLPTDIWVPATDSVRPQQSRQVAFSINTNFLEGSRLINAPNSTLATATTIRVNPKMAESFFSNPMIGLVLNSPLLLSID